MNSTTGYKLVALVTTFGAVYSCNHPADSQSNQSTFARLDAIQSSIAALREEVAAVQTRVADAEGCSVAAFLAGECAADELPDDAVLSTTFCITQGRGMELVAGYGVEPTVELELGAGWPQVVWGKGTAKVAAPVVIPPFIAIPTAIGGEGHVELGRGMEICAEVPIEPTSEQAALLRDLVSGVNIQSGIQAKYHRRSDRLLNYAARRTPIAEARATLRGEALVSQAVIRSPEESDDAFDIVDDAVERFMANGFQPHTRATELLSDPIFADLAGALDLPTSLADAIRDPQHVLNALQQIDPGDACIQVGLDAAVRSRLPNVNTLCNRIEALPNDQQVRDVASRVTSILSRVQSIFTGAQLRNFICSNVALSVFTNCP